MFVLRFDMRAPSFGASTTDLYAAALGLPPETAWRHLRIVTDEVMPAV